MAKFHDAHHSIMAIFGSPKWTAEQIKTIPSNFIGGDLGAEYIRVSVITGGQGINIGSVSGQLVIDIFVPVGEAVLRAVTIADKLDQVLVGKLIQQGNASVQIMGSTLSPSGIDAANRALYKYRYVTSFNYYGVTS